VKRLLGSIIASLVIAGALSTDAQAIVSPVNPPGGAGAPYAVSVLANLDSDISEPQPFCSGALIAPDLVLTAAHCAAEFDSANLYVGAGSENLYKNILHPVVDLVIHPGYDSSQEPSFNPLANDIALLRLGTPVKGIAPIRLAPIKDAPLRGPRSNLRVFGWGIDASGASSGWLGRAPQTDITNTSASPYADLDTEKQLLVRARRGALPCVGDSGGPLVGNRPGKKVLFLLGLVSYGSEECDPRMPVVYTRIAGQRAWIAEATRTLRGN
jgi:secreted trypsin-like serine protease